MVMVEGDVVVGDGVDGVDGRSAAVDVSMS
jgi:hypothetical protein